ncbi:hypothetical protein ACJX0J_005370, partial [Zea mays]
TQTGTLIEINDFLETFDVDWLLSFHFLSLYFSMRDLDLFGRRGGIRNTHGKYEPILLNRDLHTE